MFSGDWLSEASRKCDDENENEADVGGLSSGSWAALDEGRKQLAIGGERRRGASSSGRRSAERFLPARSCAVGRCANTRFFEAAVGVGVLGRGVG